VEAHRFRRDFLFSSRAGQDQPARPEPSLLLNRLRVQENTSKVVPHHAPAEGFGRDPELVPLGLVGLNQEHA
jgi:hypothetical protein